MPRIEFGSATDVGRVRKANEDSLAVMAADSQEPEVAMIAVADGMGGHNAGEVASALAIQSLCEQLFGKDGNGSPPLDEQLLRQAVETANATIWTAASREVEHQGMGTTLVCALVHASGEVILANVGDSRAYAVTTTEARQLTLDHSWVEEQVRAGVLTSEEAEVSPYRHMLTRSLGVEEWVTVDTYTGVRLGVGEAVVLCSDGVSGYLRLSDLLTLAGGQVTAQEAAQRMVELALERGGADNATVVIAKMMPEDGVR